MAVDHVARNMAMDAGGSAAPVDITQIITEAVSKIVADAPEDFDTLKEMSDWIASHEDSAAAMNSAILQNAADITAVETQQTEQAESIRAAAEGVALNRSTLGYSARNLLKLSKGFIGTKSGVTATQQPDGKLVVSGTNTAAYTNYIFNIDRDDYALSNGKALFIKGAETLSNCKYMVGITTTQNGAASNNWLDIPQDGIIIKGDVTIRTIYVQQNTVGKEMYAEIYPLIQLADITDDTYKPYKPSVQEQIDIVKEQKIDKTQIPDLMSLSMKMICPNNSVIPDDSGGVSAMVYIPAFKLKDVLTGYGNKGDELHPAFIVNGQAIPGFYYSKYQNHVNNGAAYSLPAKDPTTNITFDTSSARCTAKGAGWHLSTNAEWAAIALWCKKNGFMPYGNNNYGKDTRESNYRAIPTTKGTDGRTNHVATGTGPLSWSHDQTPSGIWDLNGNATEWQGGIRTVWGELQILENNDAADPNNPQNATSTCWKAINATTGALVDPECSTTDTTGTTSGNTVRLDWVSDAWVFKNAIANVQPVYKICPFGKVTAGSTIGEAAKVLLRALALLPDEGTEEADYEGDNASWHNGSVERYVTHGGGCNYGGGAGVFCVYSNYLCSSSSEFVGFRSAYIPDIG